MSKDILNNSNPDSIITDISKKSNNLEILEIIKKRLTTKHLDHLLSEGFTLEHIHQMVSDYGIKSLSEKEARTHGFMYRKQGQEQPASSSGLLFPGEIKFDDPIAPKYCHKAGSKPTAVIPPNCQVITEGFKDGFAGCVHGKIPTGSISGVTNFIYALPKNSGYTIIFDSDGWVNPDVIHHLLNAGRHVNGKINLIPKIEGEPKAGLCEFFKAGFTSEDYKKLVDSAFKPDDLLTEWINNHLTFIPEDKIDKALNYIADYSIKYFSKTKQDLLKEAVYTGFKKHKATVSKTVINNAFKRKTEILELERKSQESPDNSDSNETDMYFTQIAYQELYEDKNYISVEENGVIVLYKFKGTHYHLQKPFIEHKRIADWLERYDPHLLEDCNVQKIYKWLLLKVQVCPESVNADGINLKNGILKVIFDDSGKGSLRLDKHSTKSIFTYCSEVEYNPNADPFHCNKVLECLDPESRKIFLRTIALSFDLPYFLGKLGRPRALMLSGRGNNGKDALRTLVSSIFGEAMTICSLTDFESYDRGRKFPLSKLAKARISWSSENAALEKLEKLQSVKAAISCDPLSFEPKGKDEKTFISKAILLFNCNDMPKISSNLEAIRTRWAILNFSKTYSIKPNKKLGQLKADPRYKDDLNFVREQIAPAFLNLLEKELEDLAINGIDFEPVTENLESLQRESCHIFQFCDDLGIVEDLEAKIFLKDLWELLRNWYIEQGILEVEQMEKGKERLTWNDLPGRSDKLIKASNQVYKRFTEVFPNVKRERETVEIEKKGQFYLKGIGLTASLASLADTARVTASLTASLSEASSEATNQSQLASEASEAITSIFSYEDFEECNFQHLCERLDELSHFLDELRNKLAVRFLRIEEIKKQMVGMAAKATKEDFSALKEIYCEADLIEAFNQIKKEQPKAYKKINAICK